MEIITVEENEQMYLVNGNSWFLKEQDNEFTKLIKAWINDGNTPDKLLTEEKQNEINLRILEAENKAKKAQELSSIVVTTSKGNSFDGNETARLNMLSAIQTSELSGIIETEWKLADNSIVVVDAPELKEALALSIQEVGNIVKKY